jgi:hypothetical protein
MRLKTGGRKLHWIKWHSIRAVDCEPHHGSRAKHSAAVTRPGKLNRFVSKAVAARVDGYAARAALQNVTWLDANGARRRV